MTTEPILGGKVSESALGRARKHYERRGDPDARCAVAMRDDRRLALLPPHSEEQPQKADHEHDQRHFWFGHRSKAHVGGVVDVSDAG